MNIESFSLAVGASVTVPLIAVTGQIGQVRAPLPNPEAIISPDDGSIFTVEVVDLSLKITGVAEGEGTLTLVSGNNRVPYRVTVENENQAVRWNFSYANLGITYTPPPSPFEVDDLVNGQYVQLTFSGDGSDEQKLIDWGDGAQENTTDTIAQHEYAENGTYVILVTPSDQSAMTLDPITIYHYPTVQVATDADPTATMTHDKGDIATTIDWGDGTVDDVMVSEASHMYTANGDYTVTTTIDGFPAVTSDITIANVVVTTPLEFTVDVSADPLAAIAVTSPVSIITVDWGDGTTDADIDPATASHMYATDSTFTVTVSTSDPLYTDATAEAVIANATVGGVSSPPADAVSYGPFDIPSIQTFWVYTSASVPDWFSAAVNVDADPEPDLQIFGPQLASALRDFPTEAVSAAIAKVREVWGR